MQKMTDKKIPSNNFDNMIGNELDKKLEEELQQLDKEIAMLQIEAPEELHKKLTRKTGLKLYPHKSYAARYKIAITAFIFVVITSTVIITNPKGVTAVRNLIRELTVNKTDNSLDFSLADTSFFTNLPANFKLKDTSEDELFLRKTYENEANNYIEISLYTDSYTLALDNEKYDDYCEMNVNGWKGKKITKNGVTTMIFYIHERIVMIESDLPDTEITQILQNTKKEE